MVTGALKPSWCLHLFLPVAVGDVVYPVCWLAVSEQHLFANLHAIMETKINMQVPLKNQVEKAEQL